MSRHDTGHNDQVPTDVAPRAREGDVADVSISRNVRFCRAQPPSAHFADGACRTTLSVCLLPHPSAHLQLLRPGSALLCAWMRGPGTQALHASGWRALSSQSSWAPCPCRTSAPLPGAAQAKVTHQGSPPAAPAALLLPETTALVINTSSQPLQPSWQCHFCLRNCGVFVRIGFLRCRIRRAAVLPDHKEAHHARDP